MAPLYPTAMSVSSQKFHHLGVSLPDAGKSVTTLSLPEEDRGPVRSKAVLEVETDDGSVYRWSRLTDHEPYTFEHRVRPDGTKDSAKRPLPKAVRAFIEQVDGEILYR